MAYHRISERQQNVSKKMCLLLAKTKSFIFTKQIMVTDGFFFYFFKWLRGRMKSFQLKPIVGFLYWIITFHHYEWKHYEWISNPSPLNIMWNLYKHLHWLQFERFCIFVSQMSNCRAEEKWFWLFSGSDFAVPLHTVEQQSPLFNTVNSKVSPSFFVFFWVCVCGWGEETDRFSWKYPNGRFRDLLWAMSLTKESGHLASLHLCWCPVDCTSGWPRGCHCILRSGW